MTEFLNVFRNLDWSFLLDIVAAVIPAYICITFHEVCHGYVAYKLGDNTAKEMGRLSLNPFRHLDIIGLFCMVRFHFGWAKPVPVNMNNFKNPKRDNALTALAGPLSNFLLAVAAMTLFGVLFVPLARNGSSLAAGILDAVYATSYLSVSLAFFNILPIPPMDGSKVLFAFLPDRQYYKLMRYERYGILLLVLISWTDILSRPLAAASNFVVGKLLMIADFIIVRMM